MKVRIIATRTMHFDKEVELTQEEYNTLDSAIEFDEISDRKKEAFILMDDNLEFNDASYLGDEYTSIEIIKK